MNDFKTRAIGAIADGIRDHAAKHCIGAHGGFDGGILTGLTRAIEILRALPEEEPIVPAEYCQTCGEKIPCFAMRKDAPAAQGEPERIPDEVLAIDIYRDLELMKPRLAALEAKQAETESVVRDLVICFAERSSKRTTTVTRTDEDKRLIALAARIAGGEKA